MSGLRGSERGSLRDSGYLGLPTRRTPQRLVLRVRGEVVAEQDLLHHQSQEEMADEEKGHGPPQHRDAALDGRGHPYAWLLGRRE